MHTTLHPYINFKDNARKAFEWYRSIFGGTLEMHTFGEYHASEDPTEQDHIMHASLTVADGFAFMGSDTPNAMEFRPQAGFNISINGDDADGKANVGRRIWYDNRQIWYQLDGEYRSQTALKERAA